MAALHLTYLPEFWHEAHEGTWHSLSLPWLPKLIPPQTYLTSCTVQRRCLFHNCCQFPIFQSMKEDLSGENFLLAGSLLSYLKLRTHCQCKQQLNMRCSSLLATASSTFLWEFFLMIIFIYGTALHHSTNKNQTQTQTFLQVPCATRSDRHSGLRFYNTLQADCFVYNSAHGETFFLVLFLECLLSGNAYISGPQIGSLCEPQIQPKLLPALRHLNHSLIKGDSGSYRAARAGDYGSTHPADSTVGTWGLAQEVKELGSDIAVTHNLQSTEENLGFTWWASHEKMNDMIIITLSFSWKEFEWKCLWFLWSRWITIM